MTAVDWATADPLGEIDGRIRLLSQDRDAWQHAAADFHDAKLRAQHMIDAADAGENEARQHVRDDVQELEQLHADRALLVPPQRIGA